jgi:hypothetical protein
MAQVEVDPQWFLHEARKFAADAQQALQADAACRAAHEDLAAACHELAAAAAKVAACRDALARALALRHALLPPRHAQHAELCAAALGDVYQRWLRAAEGKKKLAAKAADLQRQLREGKHRLAELLAKDRLQELKLIDNEAQLRMARSSAQEAQDALEAVQHEKEHLYKGFSRTRANSSCKDLVLEIQSLKKRELLLEVAQHFRTLGAEDLAKHYETMDGAWHERHLSHDNMGRATAQTLQYLDLENLKHSRNLERAGKHATDAPDECLTARGDALVAPDLKRLRK